MRTEPKPLYWHLASSIDARLNCANGKNPEWFEKHEETIEQFAKDFLPSGSGIDSGCTIDLDKSNGEKIVIHTSYHHMNDGGYYDGWTEHTITVVPSLQFDFTLNISGRNRNMVKEYLYDVFREALSDSIDYDFEQKRYFSPAMRATSIEYQRKVASGEIV